MDARALGTPRHRCISIDTDLRPDRRPQPVVLTIYGLVLGIIPFIPAAELNPELVLPLVLPPLLFAATQSSSLRELRAPRGRSSDWRWD